VQAEHKAIKDWLDDVRRGVVRLPRFQRGEVWNAGLVSKFIAAVLQKRPLGVFLVLRVDPDNQPFKTRSIAGAVNNGEICREHLLDGQQRLMALWRAFEDQYEKYVFYAKFKEAKGTHIFDEVIHVIKGKVNRKWIGKPEDEFEKQCIPIPVLKPGGFQLAADWTEKAAPDAESRGRLNTLVGELHSIIEGTQLPFLPMPIETSPEDAIDTFIEVNTSSVRLKPFDIAVAQFEAETSDSLLGLVDEVRRDFPEVVRLELKGGIGDPERKSGIGDLVLKVACVKRDKKPTYSNYKHIIPTLQQDWQLIRKGLDWAAQILGDEEHIWDARLLPSTVPLRVLAALYPFIPRSGDDLSKALRLVRKYLWRSFVTDWYAKQANDRLFSDFKALKIALRNKTFEVAKGSSARPATVFDVDLPGAEALMAEGFPTKAGILKRAILAVSVRKGARDVASDVKISAKNIGEREHHHIFPDNLLRQYAGGEDPNLALNCMLLDAPTNNDWRNKWPGDYLLERVVQSGLEGARARQAIEGRLDSHLIPGGTVMRAKEIGNDKTLGQLYQDFLRERAEMILDAFRTLCEGEELS